MEFEQGKKYVIKRLVTEDEWDGEKELEAGDEYTFLVIDENYSNEYYPELTHIFEDVHGNEWWMNPEWFTDEIKVKKINEPKFKYENKVKPTKLWQDNNPDDTHLFDGFVVKYILWSRYGFWVYADETLTVSDAKHYDWNPSFAESDLELVVENETN